MGCRVLLTCHTQKSYRENLGFPEKNFNLLIVLIGYADDLKMSRTQIRKREKGPRGPRIFLFYSSILRHLDGDFPPPIARCRTAVTRSV